MSRDVHRGQRYAPSELTRSFAKPKPSQAYRYSRLGRRSQSRQVRDCWPEVRPPAPGSFQECDMSRQSLQSLGGRRIAANEQAPLPRLNGSEIALAVEKDQRTL